MTQEIFIVRLEYTLSIQIFNLFWKLIFLNDNNLDKDRENLNLGSLLNKFINLILKE